jgi:hypothetical protein
MSSTKINPTTQRAGAQTTPDARPGSGAYQAPQLLVVGKAAELVQGGGGSYADNSRARQY